MFKFGAYFYDMFFLFLRTAAVTFLLVGGATSLGYVNPGGFLIAPIVIIGSGVEAIKELKVILLLEKRHRK